MVARQTTVISHNGINLEVIYNGGFSEEMEIVYIYNMNGEDVTDQYEGDLYYEIIDEAEETEKQDFLDSIHT